MGLFTALACARRGWSVDLYEPRPLGHGEGSSHGRSRIVRRAYPDPYYTEIMVEGYPLWKEFEAMCGQPIIEEVGLVMFGAKVDEELEVGVDGLASLGVPHSVLNGARLSKALPGFRFREGEWGFFTPEAGWVNADLVCRLAWQQCSSLGVQLVQRDFQPEDSASYEVSLICAGPWARTLMDLPVHAKLMTFAHFEVESPGPVWIWHGEGYPYGFPTTDGLLKIGIHRPGQPFDPAAPSSREPDPAALAALSSFVAERTEKTLPPVEPTTCLYTMAPNDDFLMGEVSGWPGKAFYASPCSGHGFKFAPWIGRTMAVFASGEKSPADHSRFHKPAEGRA